LLFPEIQSHHNRAISLVRLANPTIGSSNDGHLSLQVNEL
jgi:hypothetical protein